MDSGDLYAKFNAVCLQLKENTRDRSAPNYGDPRIVTVYSVGTMMNTREKQMLRGMEERSFVCS